MSSTPYLRDKVRYPWPASPAPRVWGVGCGVRGPEAKKAGPPQPVVCSRDHKLQCACALALRGERGCDGRRLGQTTFHQQLASCHKTSQLSLVQPSVATAIALDNARCDDTRTASDRVA